MKRQSEPKPKSAARVLAQRSVEARKKKWGVREFKKRMREWGKLGGRPSNSSNKPKSGKKAS